MASFVALPLRAFFCQRGKLPTMGVQHFWILLCRRRRPPQPSAPPPPDVRRCHWRRFCGRSLTAVATGDDFVATDDKIKTSTGWQGAARVLCPMIPAHLLVRVYWCWGGCLQNPRGLCGLALASGAQQPGECSEYTTRQNSRCCHRGLATIMENSTHGSNHAKAPRLVIHCITN